MSTEPKLPNLQGNTLYFKSFGEDYNVEIDEIILLEVKGNYVNLVVNKDGVVEEYIIRSTLKHFEVEFSNTELRRIHRRFIANVNSIEDYKPLNYGKYKVIFKDYKEDIVTVSRRMRKNLADLVDLFVV